MLDDVLPVDLTIGLLVLGILLLDLEVLLHVDLQVEHLLALLFLDLQLLEHHISMVLLVLKRVGQLHRHLSIGLEKLGFRVGFSDTSPLDLVLELEVLFIDATLLGQRLLDLRLGHLLLVLEVLDPRLSDRDVDLDKVGFLTRLHSLRHRLFGQVAVVELASLHVLRPAVGQNLVIENINVFVKPVTLFLHLVDYFLLLSGCQFTLANVTVADQVVVVQPVIRVGIRLFLRVEDRTRVLLSVHLVLQTRNKGEKDRVSPSLAN